MQSWKPEGLSLLFQHTLRSNEVDQSRNDYRSTDCPDIDAAPIRPSDRSPQWVGGALPAGLDGFSVPQALTCHPVNQRSAASRRPLSCCGQAEVQNGKLPPWRGSGRPWCPAAGRGQGRAVSEGGALPRAPSSGLAQLPGRLKWGSLNAREGTTGGRWGLCSGVRSWAAPGRQGTMATPWLPLQAQHPFQPQLPLPAHILPDTPRTRS